MVDCELNGYSDTEELPDYRELKVIYFASFVRTWTVPKLPVPVDIAPDQYRDALRFRKFRDGIAKAFSFTREKHGAIIHRPDLVPVIDGKMCPDLNCYHVWAEIGDAEFEQLVSAVRSCIVDFCLKIEAENPPARNTPSGAKGGLKLEVGR